MKRRAFIAALGGAASGGSLPEGVNLVCAEAALPPGSCGADHGAGRAYPRTMRTARNALTDKSHVAEKRPTMLQSRTAEPQ